MKNKKKIMTVAVFTLAFLLALPVANSNLDGAEAVTPDVQLEETAYSITVDENTVCVLKEKETAEELVSDLVIKAKEYYSAQINVSLLNEIEIKEGKYLPESIDTLEEGKKALGLDVLMGEPIVSLENGETIVLSLSDSDLTEEYIETEYKTEYTYVYGVNETYEKVLTVGENGVVKRVYETTNKNGEVFYETLVYETVLSAPVNQVIEVGVTPSMQLASTEMAFFILPYVGRVSCSYGYRYLDGYEFHKGIDLVAKNGSCYGDTVVAAADGVVVESGYSERRGNYVIIEHEFRFTTTYMHFSKRLVSAGDTVSAGDSIGEIGSTGRVTGPHLHFEIKQNGKHVNPADYLKFE